MHPGGNMQLVERLNSLASFGATWVLWLLVALSCAGVAIAIDRAVYLMATKDDPRRLRSELSKALQGGDTVTALKRLQESPSAEARIAAAGLDADGVDGARERMAGMSELERLEMERRLAFLGTVGNNAPFVGLLGTVIGIIRAFRELDASAGQISSGLMTEVGEALVATAVGLLVALPAVACFNLFQRVIQQRLAQGDALGHEVLAYLSEARRG